MNALRTYLAGKPSGDLMAEEQLENVLADTWSELIGGSDGGMAGYKLRHGRMEFVTWQPPVLSFSIERHGAAAYGSVCGEVQSWDVHIERGHAILREDRTTRRQIRLKRARLRVGPIALEVATLIKDGKEDPRLYWRSPNEATIKIGKVIPDDCPQWTLSGRRRRFRAALELELQQVGWRLETNRAHRDL